MPKEESNCTREDLYCNGYLHLKRDCNNKACTFHKDYGV